MSDMAPVDDRQRGENMPDAAIFDARPCDGSAARATRPGQVVNGAP